jgi:3-deoxy-D-manno-octulosonic-acid transferase
MTLITIAYNILIHCVLWLIKIIALFSPKIKKWVEGQKNGSLVWSHKSWVKNKNSQQTIANSSHDPRPTTHDFKTAWFHAASLGEFEQGRPVIEAFRKQYPDSKIVLTFFSPSGYEIRKNYDIVDLVCYLPADTLANVRQFLDTIQPDIVFFIKYEFWFNYLTELKRRQITTILFSAIFRANQPFFKWYGAFHRQMLFCFDSVLVQNQTSFDLLKSVHYQNVIMAGDTRFDRVLDISKTVQPLPDIEAFKGDDLLLIVGSAWPDDMDVLIPFINNFKDPLKIIIAPHEIDLQQIQKWQNQMLVLDHVSCVWSQFSIKPITQDLALSTIFIDSIGLLSSLYQYADFAFIGGAFGDGLHNILEPAVFGMPIFFGDKFYDKFQEAHDLMALGAAFSVSDSMSFEKIFIEIYQNQTLRRQTAQRSADYVQRKAGSTAIVIEQIKTK